MSAIDELVDRTNEMGIDVHDITDEVNEELKDRGPQLINAPSWGECAEDQKHLIISQMIVEAGRALQQGDPVIAILVPPGHRDDVEALWNGEMNQIINDQSIIEEGHPNHRFYFPPVQENPQVPFPVLYKRTHQEESLLREYFNRVLQESGVDTSTLLPATLSLEALRGFYLAAEILLPAAAKVQRDPASRLVVPAGGIIRP